MTSPYDPAPAHVRRPGCRPLARLLLIAALSGCGSVEESLAPDGGAGGADAGGGLADGSGAGGGPDAQAACDDGWTGPDCLTCVVYVDGGGGDDDSSGLSWSSGLETLNAGIEAALARQGTDGVGVCEVWVSAGIYLPGLDRSASFVMAPGVHLYGGFEGGETAREQRDWELNETILSGDLDQDQDPSGNAFHVVVGATGVLDGFTVTAGNADGDAPDNHAGGLYNDNASPLITNVEFRGNTARIAGAVANLGASAPILTNVTFRENSAISLGGAMYSADSSAPQLVDVEFSNNSSVSTTTSKGGGAMHNTGTSAPVLRRVAFRDNIAPVGGAVRNRVSSTPTFSNVVFSGNTATGFNGGGGAMMNSAEVEVELINAVFVGNSADRHGGAIYEAGASLMLTNVSFSENAAVNGGALLIPLGGDVVRIRNSILWGDSSEFQISESETGDNTPDVVVSFSIVEGGVPEPAVAGPGVQTTDPAFVEAELGDLHLVQNSPAIDAGNSGLAALSGVDEDLDGNARIVDGGSGQAVIDLGAYEHQGP